MIRLGIILVSVFSISACVNDKTQVVFSSSPVEEIVVPKFDADSAFFYIKKQVEFGPRVPNSAAHQKCHDYLVQKFSEFGAETSTQSDFVRRFDGEIMNMKNIIASFNKDVFKRVLLCAHWDSRFLADNDSIKVNTPILGANDGGSGVGVLLEIARQIQLNSIPIGVDIVLFDVEDQGEPNGTLNPKADSWCLGSQYWSRNPHVLNYFADYGILLDMVGGKNARFTKEGVSRKFASRIVDRVWGTASKLGYSNYFVSESTPPIIDDHLYINNLIHIPTINIVEYDVTTHNRFNKHHHKHSDNLSIIDKKTLKVVGQTVLEVLYNES
jgi:glutaminyl-peptide cyclotransferase